MKEPKLMTKKLSELFDSSFALSIPEYQRAYEWESYHVKNLLLDTFNVQHKDSSYLMGTIILHENGNQFDIIDGQQRLITLSILLHYFEESANLPLIKAEFNNVKSFYYIKNTQNEISAFLKNKTALEAYKKYLLEKLEFSVLIISGHNAIDQAYTFFDSANSKGKSLNDFDLLKAHHLMYIPSESEDLAREHNDFWQMNNHKHNEVFSNVLRRIRMWSRGHDRDDHSDRNNFYEFISVNDPYRVERNRHLFNGYMQPNRFDSWHRENGKIVLLEKLNTQLNNEVSIPFEIPQTIEGGDSFFLYAKRYHEMFEFLFGENEDNNRLPHVTFVNQLSKSIDNNFLATAFKAVMLLYYDKFRDREIIEVAVSTELLLSEIRFRWGTKRPSPLRIETSLSKVKSHNMIPVILSATLSDHVVKLFSNQLSVSERETNDSPTLERYLHKIRSFYEANKHLLTSEIVLEKLNFIYKLK